MAAPMAHQMALQMKRALCLSVGLIVSGCATYTPPPPEVSREPPRQVVVPRPIPQPDTPVPAQPRVEVPRPKPAPHYLPTPPAPQPQPVLATAVPAAKALLDKARLARKRGLLAEADALLERAMRLAPSEPTLYLETAEVRLAQGNYAAAAQFAQKSLSLLGNRDAISSRDQRAQAWRVIAEARTGQGDERGAAQARREMDRWY